VSGLEDYNVWRVGPGIDKVLVKARSPRGAALEFARAEGVPGAYHPVAQDVYAERVSTGHAEVFSIAAVFEPRFEVIGSRGAVDIPEAPEAPRAAEVSQPAAPLLWSPTTSQEVAVAALLGKEEAAVQTLIDRACTRKFELIQALLANVPVSSGRDTLLGEAATKAFREIASTMCVNDEVIEQAWARWSSMHSGSEVVEHEAPVELAPGEREALAKAGGVADDERVRGEDDPTPCTVCGEGVLYGSRHPKCAERAKAETGTYDGLDKPTRSEE